MTMTFRKALTAVLLTGLGLTGLAGCGSDNLTQPNSVTSAGAGAPPGNPPDGGPGGQLGGSASETNGTAATTLDNGANTSGQTYNSIKVDENAVRVEANATATLTNPTITKTGDSSNTNNSDFYGMNAGVLVRDGGSLTLTGGTVTTDGSGANGVFVYGTGTTTVSGATIRTSSDNSGGVEVAGGGSLTATNLDIETRGGSSAAIRSDRGGGRLTVDQGSYVTNGLGSPAVYSTANITVSNATLTSHNAEAVVIEGANSVALTNCAVTGDMTQSNGSSADNLHSIMIYQSMSGDASQGGGSFTMTGGSLTNQTGDVFYVTNTTATIALSGVAVTTGPGNLLTVAGNDGSRGWGTAGSNGGTVSFTATGQTLSGAIVVDQISSLNLTLTSGSAFTGTINSSGTAGAVAVTLSADSTWTLTGDSYISSFSGATSGIVANGHHVYVAGKTIV